MCVCTSILYARDNVKTVNCKIVVEKDTTRKLAIIPLFNRRGRAGCSYTIPINLLESVHQLAGRSRAVACRLSCGVFQPPMTTFLAALLNFLAIVCHSRVHDLGASNGLLRLRQRYLHTRFSALTSHLQERLDSCAFQHNYCCRAYGRNKGIWSKVSADASNYRQDASHTIKQNGNLGSAVIFNCEFLV